MRPVRRRPGDVGMIRWWLLALAGLLLGGGPALGAEIHSVEMVHEDRESTLTLGFDQAVPYQILPGEDPLRLTVQFEQTRLGASLAGLPLSQGPVRQLRFAGGRSGNPLRLEMELRTPVRTRSYFLSSDENSGQLVLKLYDRETAPLTVYRGAPRRPRRDLVIVIDAGHGGHDSGALGVQNIKEKHIVLAISLYLAQEINNHKGYRAVLTRDHDVFLTLGRRREIAEERNADLFVSIHADWFKQQRVSGPSVFVVSDQGSSSNFARLMAERENRSNNLGIMEPPPVAGGLEEVLLDLHLDKTVLEPSVLAGQRVLKELGKVTKLHSPWVESAGFAVLKLRVPSILVETGFISNPQDAQRLLGEAYQQRIARSIWNGIRTHFEESPPVDISLAWLKTQGTHLEHVVVRGETLSSIARSYRLEVRQLREYNRLEGDLIRVGETLLIPASRRGTPPKAGLVPARHGHSDDRG